MRSNELSEIRAHVRTIQHAEPVAATNLAARSVAQKILAAAECMEAERTKEAEQHDRRFREVGEYRQLWEDASAESCALADQLNAAVDRAERLEAERDAAVGRAECGTEHELERLRDMVFSKRKRALDKVDAMLVEGYQVRIAWPDVLMFVTADMLRTAIDATLEADLDAQHGDLDAAPGEGEE